jgi:hypothetical protein
LVAASVLPSICFDRADAADVTAAVFDGADRFQGHVVLQTYGNRLRDPNGGYDVVLVSSSGGAPKVASTFAQNRHQGTLVVFADIDHDRVIPCVPWSDYRIFARPACAAGSPAWDGLERYESVRPVRLEFGPPASPLPFEHLVAYSIPAHVASKSCMEILACPRPDWQRRFARKVEFDLPSGASSAIVTMSHLPSSLETTTALVGGGIGYQAEIPESEPGKAVLFYVPKSAPVAGETVAVLDAAGGLIESWGCGAPATPFAAPVLRERTDDTRQLVLQINAANIGFPLPNVALTGDVLLPDGERIPFASRTSTGSVFEWPAHCALGESLFEISGRAGAVNLPRAVFTVEPGDTAFDGPRGFHLERLDVRCAVPKLSNLGGAIKIPTRYPHCD